jgi:hypothetical protein
LLRRYGPESRRIAVCIELRLLGSVITLAQRLKLLFTCADPCSFFNPIDFDLVDCEALFKGG